MLLEILEIFIIQEWEVYVLSKLQWNPPTVVATDLLDDLLKRVTKHRPELSVERTKAGVESLLEQALLSYRMSSFSPAVTAAAAILLTIRQHFSSPSTTTSTPVSRSVSHWAGSVREFCITQ